MSVAASRLARLKGPAASFADSPGIPWVGNKKGPHKGALSLQKDRLMYQACWRRVTSVMPPSARKPRPNSRTEAGSGIRTKSMLPS